MTIIYRTSLELTLEKEVVELRGAVARSIQAINAYEREVNELKNKALMDYAMLAGNAVLIKELEQELLVLRASHRDIDFAYMEGFDAAKHEARDAYHPEIDDLKRLLAQALEQNTALDKKLAEYENGEPVAYLWRKTYDNRNHIVMPGCIVTAGPNMQYVGPLYCVPSHPVTIDKDKSSW